eukprot:Colp12_sorted_trinity150504_noHs@3303
MKLAALIIYFIKLRITIFLLYTLNVTNVRNEIRTTNDYVQLKYLRRVNGSNLGGKLRDSLEEIGNETDIGHLEDGSLGVLVDGNNGLAVLHTSQVLNGTRDTDSNVKLRGNDLASLADLKIVGNEAGINGGTGSTDGSLKLVSKIVEKLEVVTALKTTTTRDHNAGSGEIGSLALGELLLDELSTSLGSAHGKLLSGSVATISGSGRESSVAHRHDLHLVVGLDSGGSVAGIDGADKGVSRLNSNDVRDRGDIKLGSNTGNNVLAESASRGSNVGVATLGLGLHNGGGNGLGKETLVGLVVNNNNLAHILDLLDSLNNAATAATNNKGSDGVTKGLGGSDGVKGGGLNSSVVVLDEHQGRVVANTSAKGSTEVANDTAGKHFRRSRKALIRQ